MRRQSPKQEGFALVVVLWAGLLLALMAAGFATALRSRLRDTAAKVDTARAQALANAGINLAILDLVNTQESGVVTGRFARDGSPLSCSLDGGQITIEVEDDEGKININSASDELLAALFQGLGATAQDAQSYADRITDYRDADQDKRGNGAERDDYRKAGYPEGPKDAPFTSVSELDQVMGLPADITQRAKPLLTTALAHSGVDPTVASKDLKEVLGRGSSLFVRSASSSDADSIFAAGGIPQDFSGQSSRQAYTIRAQALLPEGARYVSETAVILRPGLLPVYRYWQRSDGLHSASRAVSGADPC